MDRLRKIVLLLKQYLITDYATVSVPFVVLYAFNVSIETLFIYFGYWLYVLMTVTIIAIIVEFGLHHDTEMYFQAERILVSVLVVIYYGTGSILPFYNFLVALIIIVASLFYYKNANMRRYERLDVVYCSAVMTMLLILPHNITLHELAAILLGVWGINNALIYWSTPYYIKKGLKELYEYFSTPKSEFNIMQHLDRFILALGIPILFCFTVISDFFMLILESYLSSWNKILESYRSFFKSVESYFQRFNRTRKYEDAIIPLLFLFNVFLLIKIVITILIKQFSGGF